MIDLNEFYARYNAHREEVMRELVQQAVDEIFKAVLEGYYVDVDLKRPNYTEICEWLGWPNFQDGGLFEQAIDKATKMILDETWGA